MKKGEVEEGRGGRRERWRENKVEEEIRLDGVREPNKGKERIRGKEREME